MSPKTDISFYIIRWESILASKCIKCTKYIIHYIISEDTVSAIDYSVKLS